MSPAAGSGYSGTPLAKKLGIKEGSAVATLGAPSHYQELLEPVPDNVKFTRKASGTTHIVHVFAKSRRDLALHLAALRDVLAPDATVWVSWPKKASKVATDITEDTIRADALPMGWVDVKVCAVDEVWSGLNLVVRKELR
ncbi:MAG: DUF3052 domain-containing protein [Gemmatimonas sp.]